MRLRAGAERTLLVAGAVAALSLHLRAAYHYPPPWPDEAHFLAPALSLVRDHTLATPQLGLPGGIFWMPDGYYAALAVAFTLLPWSLATARALSIAFALGFGVCLLAVVRRCAGATPPLTVALVCWLVAPRVVLLANVARMEALLLAVAGGALLLVAWRRWAGALAVASLAALLHPAGVLVFVAFLLAALITRPDLGPRGRVERGLLGVVGLAWLAEGWHVASHFELAREHLGFQLARKQRRGLAVAPGQVILVMAAGCGAFAASRNAVAGPPAGEDRRPADAPDRTDGRGEVSPAAVTAAGDGPTAAAAFLLAGALTLVAVVGREMWYEVLGWETAALLLVVGLVCLPRRRERGTTATTVAAVTAAAAVAVALVTVPRAYDIYGLRLDAATAGEYAEFVYTAVAELRRLDAAQTGPRTVLVDDLSGFPPFLAERSWRHLRFVQRVPVGAVTEADFALWTLAPPQPLRDFVAQRMPAGPPLLAVSSESGTFELRLYLA